VAVVQARLNFSVIWRVWWMNCSYSLLAFYQRRGFAIKSGVIEFARLQIKFVDHDLHQRRSWDSEKNSQQPKHGGGRKSKEQDIDRMQSHLFAQHAWHKNV